jgi:hypothetical protein
MFLVILAAALSSSDAIADWVENGTVVSTTASVANTGGSVHTQRSTSDNAGGLIIAWIDDTSSDPSIRAQRIDTNGNTMWATDAVLALGGTGGSELIDIHILPDGSGGAFISWIDNQVNDQVLLTRINSLGNQVWAPQVAEVSPQIASIQSFDMVSDNQGGVFCFWVAHPTGVYDVYGQWVDPLGTRIWPTAGAPICTDASHALSVTASSLNHHIVVAWRDFRDGVDRVYAQRLAIGHGSTATIQWTANGIPISTGSSSVYNIDLLVTAESGAIFTWTEDSIIKMSRRDPLGADQFGYTINISTPGTPNADYGRLISDGADGAIVVWSDNHNGITDGLYAQRISPVGFAVWTYNGAPVSEVGGGVILDDVISMPDGGATIVWNIGSTLSAQRLTPYGTPIWPTDGLSIRTEYSSTQNAQILDDGVGGMFISWSDSRAEFIRMPYVQRIEADHGSWGHPEPTIVSAFDVPGDQGGAVKVNWTASGRDILISPDTITHYSVWRAIDPATISNLELPSLPVVDPAMISSGHNEKVVWVEDKSGASWYWEWVGNQDAYRFAAYSYTTPTSYDSIPGDPALHAFLVLAHSADPTMFWESNIGAGYSVDNLAPSTPLALNAHASFTPQSLDLNWAPNTEVDLSSYRVYRGQTSDFFPDVTNLVTTTTDTLFTDPGWAQEGGYHYKVSAFDVHENESGFALISPDAVTAVDGLPNMAVLYTNYPNPFNPATMIRFELGQAGPTTLKVHDLAGRVVRTLLQGDLVAEGRHDITWKGRDDFGRAVAAGTYVVRLRTGAQTQTQSMTLVK